MAERLIKMRQAFANHRDHIPEDTQQAMQDEFTAAAREIEDAMVRMLPWLGDDERAAAIRILAELRGGLTERLPRRWHEELSDREGTVRSCLTYRA